MGVVTWEDAGTALDAVEALAGLPLLNTVRARVRGLLVQGDAALDAIAQEASSDLGLACRVLAAANRDGPAADGVEAAVAVLRADGIRELVADGEVFDLLEPASEWGWLLHRERRHALGVRSLALGVARLVGMQEHDRIATAALLHDVGRLALARRGRLPRAGLTAAERVRRERLEFGADHALVGGFVARRWQLPDTVVHAIARHHSEVAGLAAVIRLADSLWHHVNTGPAPKAVRLAAAHAGVSPGDAAQLLEAAGRRIAGRPPARVDSPLSPRQHEIIRLLGQGKTYKQIAKELGLSTSTLRSHLSHAYRKLGVNDRAQAVLTAARHGWI